jgi:MFS transporter, DHA2 family, methylenomycin A resistance protein
LPLVDVPAAFDRVAAAPGTGPDHRRPWLVVVGAGLGYFAMFFNTAAVSVALPSVQDAFRLDIGELQWFVNAYALMLAVGLMTAGRLSDRVGRRRIFLIGTGLLAVASIEIAVAPTYGWLVFGRVLQGVAAAALISPGLVLVADAFANPTRRGRAVSVWLGIAALGTAIGPLGGGVLVDAFGWESVFLANLPLSAAAGLLLIVSAKESRDREFELALDFGGFWVLGIGSAALLLALQAGPRGGWLGTGALICLAAALVLFLVLPLIERRAPTPLIDMGTLRRGRFAGPVLVSFALNFAFFGVLYFESLYLINILDASAVTAGLALLPLTLTLAVVSIGIGPAIERLGAVRLVVAGMLLLALGLVLQLDLDAQDHPGTVALPLFVMGLGIALVLSPVSHVGLSAVPGEQAGTAAGVLATARQFGSVFGVAVFGAVVSTIEEHRISGSFEKLVHRDELAGLLTGSHRARELLAHEPGSHVRVIYAHAQDIFTSALADALGIAAAVVLVSLAIALVLIRRDRRVQSAMLAPEPNR